MVALELAALLFLVLLNGALSMSELAVVSARRPRLQQWADGGNRRAAAALRLAEHPDHFLATVQVGITLVGILAGAFAGATVSQVLAQRLARTAWLAPYAEAIALAVVVLAITYVSLILGELVPKRLALRAPERVASLVARPMTLLSRAVSPVVKLLAASTSLVLRVFGVKPTAEPPVTEEEIKLLVGQGADAGLFERAEQALVERVFRLGDRRVASLMTPRPRLTWLDVGDGPDTVLAKIAGSPYSRFPVAEGHLDHCLGYVQARDLLDRCMAGEPFDLRAALRQPLLVPDSTKALALLESFRSSGTHIAFVIDEYGGVDGLVTLTDVLEALVGELPSEAEEDGVSAVLRDDGSLLVDGAMALEDLRALVPVPVHHLEERGAFATLGGFVMARLGRVARAGDAFEWGGHRFEVMDVDGTLVDKVLVTAVGIGHEEE